MNPRMDVMQIIPKIKVSRQKNPTEEPVIIAQRFLMGGAGGACWYWGCWYWGCWYWGWAGC